MQMTIVGLRRRRFIWLPVVLFVLTTSITVPAFPDFWSSLTNKSGPDIVKITRILPAVAARNGSTVRFEAQVVGSIPVETGTILREQIRTLLLHAKTGEIQLVDGPADTEIKCTVTSYEPKTIVKGTRNVGTATQTIETWVGNMNASVQVLDSRDHPLDAANIKNHLENDFVIGQEARTSPTATKAHGLFSSLGSTSIGRTLGVGSAAAGAVTAPGSGGANGKGARPPTDAEWRESLVEGLAVKVANRIVPVENEVVAVLPVEKDFDHLRELAKTGHWGNVEEAADKMGTLSGNAEADRLYMIGLSYEASGYAESAKPDDASTALNKASEFYGKAVQLKPNEREFFLAQLRVQDAVDHYVAIQQYLQTHGAGKKPEPVVQTASASAGAGAEDNAALIEMTTSGLPEAVVLSYIDGAKDPKFDISAQGLILLSRSKVPAAIIQAVQKKMAKDGSTKDGAGKAPATQAASGTQRKPHSSTRTVADPHTVQ